MGTQVRESFLKENCLLVSDVVGDQGDQHLGRGQPRPQPGGEHSAGSKAVASLDKKFGLLQLLQLPCEVQWWRGTLTERPRVWSERRNVKAKWRRRNVKWEIVRRQSIESRKNMECAKDEYEVEAGGEFKPVW